MSTPVSIVAVIAITVSASSAPKGMIERALVEADEIWRTAGVV